VTWWQIDYLVRFGHQPDTSKQICKHGTAHVFEPLRNTMSRYIALIAAAVTLLAIPHANAQEFPSRPIKIIVCLPAGGGVDTVTRIIADKLPQKLGQPVVIENKGGQSGNLGAEAVWLAEPDGYTLLASQPAPITTSPLLFKKLAFDPTTFVPVAVMSAIPNTLLVRANFPAKTAVEFIAYVKANPGKVNYASQGNGTTSHLTGVMFDRATGTQMNHVPYRGTAPALNDLLGGHVDIFFNELATSVEQHKAGKARILAVTTAKRLAELPDIPTLQEAGLAGFVSDTWNAISAPPKTPPAIVAKLNAAINDVLKMPEVKAQFDRMHLLGVGGTTQDMAKLVKDDTARWGAVIKAANLKVE
jgi:tripartite-type tricarboxylate transporter receptor subunit TctC